MRSFLIILGIVAVLIGAMALYLALSTPGEAAQVRFPLNASQRALLARVPPSADSFALVPTAALLQGKLLANPVTRDAIDQWLATHDVPRPWLVGGADAVIWRNEKKVSYAIRLDPFRAFLVRLWLMSSTDAVGVWDGKLFVIGNIQKGMGEAALDALLAPAGALPPGDVLVVQRDRTRGAFPPLARPAVTSITISPASIDLVSRAAAEPSTSIHSSFSPEHPNGALLSVVFTQPPHLLGDAQRLLGTNLSTLVENGGGIALYDVDTGTLLPRPKAVFTIPANEKTRAAAQDLAGVIQLVGATHDTGKELFVAFDHDSLPLYLKDRFSGLPWPATEWSLRMDARRMAPLLEQLNDNRGLRLVAGRVHRAVRDLRRWTGALQQARTIEAADSVSGGVEELRVRIASK